MNIACEKLGVIQVANDDDSKISPFIFRQLMKHFVNKEISDNINQRFSFPSQLECESWCFE